MLAGKLAAATSSSYAFRSLISPTTTPNYNWSQFGGTSLNGRPMAVSDLGDYIFVGGPTSSQSSPSYTQNGLGEVFIRTGNVWPSQQVIIPNSAYSYSNFGWSAAMSGDGATLAVGLPGYPNTYSNIGAVRVYTRVGTTWSIEQFIQSAFAAGLDAYWGQSIALSQDGNTFIAVSRARDYARVYTRTAGVWTEQQLITSITGESAGSRGLISVALSSDGNTAIIGATNKDTAPYTDSGAAYVYTRSGGVWTLQQQLTASDKASFDEFGYSVSLSGDGNLALVGAPYKTVGANASAGKAYVFTRSGGVWTQTQILTANPASASNIFGFSVWVSRDKTKAFVGLPGYTYISTPNAGAVYVYDIIGGGTLSYKQLIPQADTFGGITGNVYFGWSVTSNASGSIMFTAAPFYGSGGRAYAYA